MQSASADHGMWPDVDDERREEQTQADDHEDGITWIKYSNTAQKDWKTQYNHRFTTSIQTNNNKISDVVNYLPPIEL